MAGYFGNQVTLSADGASVGTIKSITVPPREFARVDFTVLGDTVQQQHLSPVMDAGELEFTLLADNSIAAQKAIFDDVGTDTAQTFVLTFPWASNNTYTFSGKIYGDEISEVQPAESLDITFKVVMTTTFTVTTV
jgi:hypothetical protein